MQGDPEVSWRVKLLPYIELNHIYQLYEFKSTWDSQANWTIASRKVELFTCPSEPDLKSSKGGRFTSYVMLENTNRLHSPIGTITPTYCLAGLSEVIEKEPERELESARKSRQEKRAASKQVA